MSESSYVPFNWKTFKWLFLAALIPPFYFQLSNYIKYGINKMDSAYEFFFWTSISIVVTFGITIIVFQEIKWLEKVLPWKKRAKFRLPAEFLITNITVLTLMGIFGLFTFEAHCSFHGNVGFKEHMLHEFTIGVVLLTFVLSFVEGNYFFTEWKKSLLLTEKLKKESLEAQLESLKNQVNPHFLFNSLNVLSNLVHKDANRAEEFIDQFASVYRYVLNIQDKAAVTLGDELDFINSYIFLQKIRFQNGFTINIDIDKDCYGHYVVPMSLQMMLENAIKHNVVAEEDPLDVKIYLEEDRIFVVNKINLRFDENKSIGMGLNNLRQRYFLLSGIMPEFDEKNGDFVASIPLLKPEKEKTTIEDDKCCNHRRRKIRSGKTRKTT
ncbi:MAG: histidine kinase [Salinivirgaceae bacterium]|jgi:two-component system LytT family sensor kinase|nr:histidine kinase [Salinivirgaceae bacterium]